jgi:hypothetical protein
MREKRKDSHIHHLLCPKLNPKITKLQQSSAHTHTHKKTSIHAYTQIEFDEGLDASKMPKKKI